MENESNFEIKQSRTFPSSDKKERIEKFVNNSAVIHSWSVLLDPEYKEIRLKLEYHPEFTQSSDVGYQTVAKELSSSKNFNATVTGYNENSVIIEPIFSSKVARKYDKDDDVLF